MYKFHICHDDLVLRYLLRTKQIHSISYKKLENDSTENQTRSGVTKPYKDRQLRPLGHLDVYCVIIHYVINSPTEVSAKSKVQ